MIKNLREEIIRACKDKNGEGLENLVLELNSNTSKTSEGCVNHFKVGGDPEFILLVENAGALKQRNAHSLGLETGSAFGADTSGRQIEIRPWASRSVLEVVASTFSTLRWFSSWLQEKHDIKTGDFVCSPYFNGDGLGGHIHFGRRIRKSQDIEASALDTLSEIFGIIGVFDSLGVNQRRSGAGYGRLHEVRHQKYGYEYRTYPTWLSSPAQMMVVLTLAKLVVVDPSLFNALLSLQAKTITPTVVLEIILKLYKKRGDKDSALCLDWINSYGWPKSASTFGSEWGLPANPVASKDIEYFPTSIKPTLKDIEAIEIMLRGERIPVQWPLVPNWTPTKVPIGFNILKPDNGVGMGELCKGLCYPMKEKFIVISGSGRGVEIAGGLVEGIKHRLGANWKTILTRILGFPGIETIPGHELIRLGPDVRKDRYRSRVRAVLKAALPIFPIETLQESCKEIRFIGEEIANV